MTITAEQAQRLRAPFKPSQIGKLPKPTKKENAKGRCQECGGWHGLPAVHLDYVGHAAITDRLLEVDPEWTWEPMATDTHGFPLLDQRGGLWIWLTVCGVRRPGYGDETNGKGMKEIIGDALRNGAMRFGVGLDLWSKEDLHAEDSSVEPQPGRESGSTRSESVGVGARAASASSTADDRPRDPHGLQASRADFQPPNLAGVASPPQKGKIRALIRNLKLTDEQVASDIGDIEGLTKQQAHETIEKLLRLEANRAAA